MGHDIYNHIQVPALRPLGTRISLASQLEMLAVLHPRRDLDVDLARLSDSSRSPAVPAGVGYDLALAAAFGAGG